MVENTFYVNEKKIITLKYISAPTKISTNYDNKKICNQKV